ncbi:hypothetical protein FDUTEX481_02616 [Tolypothrix sp. PCC 7601]|nr:hypothetical protein FDUTEX481_02616 [Tolypothrix sp. PCC 7601]
MKKVMSNKLISYSLLITHYSLLITHYSLLITHYSLLITHDVPHILQKYCMPLFG